MTTRAPYCPHCQKYIDGEVFGHQGGNCCEPCYRRLTHMADGDSPTSRVAASTGVPSLRALAAGGEVQIPTRQEIRAYVAHQTALVKAHAAAGGNPHHMILDHQDQLDKFAGTLPDPQRAELLRVYTEEMSASVEAIKLEIAAKESQAAAAAGNGSAIGSTIAIILLFVVLPTVFRGC